MSRWAAIKTWWYNHHYWCRGVCYENTYHRFSHPINGRNGAVIWRMRCRICGKGWTNMMPP